MTKPQRFGFFSLIKALKSQQKSLTPPDNSNLIFIPFKLPHRPTRNKWKGGRPINEQEETILGLKTGQKEKKAHKDH